MSELSKFTAKLSELLKKDALFLASELIDGDGLLALTEDETRRKKRTVKLSDAPASVQIIKVVSPVLPVIQIWAKGATM